MNCLIFFLLTLLNFSTIVSGQATPPDHYYDFSKITNQNGMEFVLDQITQDQKVSFAFNISSGCVNQTYTPPVKTADGVAFVNSNNIPNPSLVINNANVIQFSSTWMVAMWVKVTYRGNSGRQETLMAASSNTNGSTYNNYNPLFRLNIQSSYYGRTGLYFDTVLVDPMNYANSYRAAYITGQMSSLNQGWVLVSVSVDSGTNSDTKITLRTRTPNDGKDSLYNTVNGYIYNTNLNFTLSNDIVLGSSCWRDSNTQYYQDGLYATIGRVYIWKTVSNTMNEPQFDKFFFRQSTGIPICTGYIPCQYCVVDYPFPASFTVALSCSTNSVAKNVTTFYDWNFDFDMNPEYVTDQSGNGYKLYFNPVNQLTDQFWRVPGQGYYIDSHSSSAFAYARNYIAINNYQQYTFEMWVRRDISMPVPAGNYGVMLQFYQSSTNTPFFIWGASDKSQSVYAAWPNSNLQVGFSGIMSTNKWTFVSVGLNFINQQGNKYCSSVWNVDGNIQISYNNVNSQPSVPAVDSTTQLQLVGQGYYYIKRHRMFNFMKYADEMNTATSKFSSGTCSKISIQPQCDVCPYETNQCLPVCGWNQYGTQCKNCHAFCGGCTGGTRNDCLYCTKSSATSKVVRSLTYGNCTCMVGYYYDSVSDSCLACNTNCNECYGPAYTQCLTCKTGNAFFPPSICVTSCSDPAVLAAGAGLGYFLQSDTVNSQTFLSCLPCHPYCQACSGGMNSQCSACNTGYLLLGTTCTDTCPAGQWANLIASQCQACDSTCATCNGPLASNCLTCTNLAYVQQTGVCQASCNNGFYSNSAKVCMDCNPACAICLNQYSNNCTSCNTGYYLSWLGFTCGTSCQSGTYADSITNQCLICHYSCLTCSGGGADQCTQCANSFLRSGVNCVTQCSSNQFQVGNSCLSCDSKCSICSGVLETQCSFCNLNLATGRGFYFFNNSCLEQCPDGYYPNDLLRTCEACPKLCKTCAAYTNCTSCIYGPYKLNAGECTYFSCLGYQYRGVSPQLSCYDCDTTCQTCQGFSQFDCLTCLSPSKFVNQQCLTCEDQPGMMSPLDSTQLSCQEICGDGFNYGSVQCDDGNNINGDGCSSKCSIEQGWSCEGGSKLSPDVCSDVQNPVPTLALINSQNQLYITFSKEVNLQSSLDSKTLKVTVTGSQTSYKFNWNINDQYRTSLPVQQLVLDMTFYCSLKGSSELVTVEFLDPNIYMDASGNPLTTAPLTGYLSSYTYVDPALRAQLDAAGSTSMLATFGALAINLAISLIFGGQISAMWTMINTIQMVSLLPLCNINFPQITVLVFSKMLASQGETTIIPNIYFDNLVNRTGSGLKIELALNTRFSSYGWVYSNFLYLSGRKILIWTGLLISYPIVWYMKSKYADKHKLCRFWISTEQKYRYTMVLRGVIMSYLSMYLAAILNVYAMNFDSLENTISLFASVAFTIALTYLPVQIMNILQRNYAKIQETKFMTQYSTIIKEVDLSHPIRYMYYPVFLIRRAVFALELLLLANYPIGQIAAMSFTSFVMMIYIVIVRPQKGTIMIVLTAAGEGLLLFLHLFSIVFLDEDLPEEKKTKLGWFVIIIVGMYVIINWVIILTITIKDMIGKYKLWKEEKKLKKLKLKEDEDYLKWKKKKHIMKRMEKEQRQEAVREVQQDKILEYQQQKLNEELDKNQGQTFGVNKMPIFEVEKLDEGQLENSSQSLFYQNNQQLLQKIQQLHYQEVSQSATERFQSQFMMPSYRSVSNQYSQRPYSQDMTQQLFLGTHSKHTNEMQELAENEEFKNVDLNDEDNNSGGLLKESQSPYFKSSNDGLGQTLQDGDNQLNQNYQYQEETNL